VLVGGAPAGTVTSGNFSPVLERGIALAFVRPDLGLGTAVEIDLRGTHAPGTVVATPFVHPTRTV
jgi:aminomethyltransferase